VSTLRTFGIALASAATATSLALAGQAVAHQGHHGGSGNHSHAQSVPAPPAQPTRDDQIQNVDQVKTAIKAYYGDTPTTTPDPVNGATTLHTFNPNGAYAHQMQGLEHDAAKYLSRRAHHSRTARHDHGDHPSATGTKAILLDVDDTSLNTYNYEIYSNFVFNPTTNGAFVNAAAFPAVPGMPELAAFATSKGYDLFFLTGRPEAQRPGTTTNLANAGFPAAAADHLYLKDLTAPWLASCAPTCTTVQYKSLTRQHIESLGFDIVANFGDQFSDLTGGFADKTFKVPNPMYFLP
jgi:putative acid phosphatase of HAD superfamily subfamily IIIB